MTEQFDRRPRSDSSGSRASVLSFTEDGEGKSASVLGVPIVGRRRHPAMDGSPQRERSKTNVLGVGLET